jgi:hypothetical protein
MKRLLSYVITLLLAFDSFIPTAFASQRISVAVAESNDSAEQGIEVATGVRGALRNIDSFHIIDPEIIKQVIDYYGAGRAMTSTKFPEAKEFLSRAQDHYYRMNYEEARAEAKRAIEFIESDPVPIHNKGQLLFDALMTQGLIAKAMKDDETLHRSLERVVILSPSHELDRSSYPPSIVKLYNEKRVRIQENGVGEIEVNTSPQVAEVFINGIECGVTPLKLHDLPTGRYAIMIKTNKYQSVMKTIDLAPGDEESISVQLKWDGKESTQVGNEIEHAIEIAELLKADRSVILSAHEEKNGDISARARVADRHYRAAFRPIIARYDTSNEEEVLAQFNDQIKEFLLQDLTDDPASFLDPDGVADPILLGKQKKKLYTHPIFWGAMGTAVVGAVVGGILAATGGGGSGDGEGSIRVRFR